MGIGADWRHSRSMDSMNFALRLSRVTLLGIAHILGSLGIFWLCECCIGRHLAAHAIICLGTAATITLACEGIDRGLTAGG